MTTDQPGTEAEPTWAGERRRTLWRRALMVLLLVAANIAVVGEILHQLHKL
jgi:hypothetical protein